MITKREAFQILLIKFHVDLTFSSSYLKSIPSDEDVARKNLNESHPYESITSIGSTPLPNDLDIFLPSPSNTKPCETTALYEEALGVSDYWYFTESDYVMNLLVKGGYYSSKVEIIDALGCDDNTATIYANPWYADVRFVQWSDGNTDNPRVITVTQDESYTAVFVEKTMSEGYEYVDLGLSVKWATCNVGANSPEEYGDYFAWGETEPKAEYSWENYKWCDGTASNMIKYNKTDGLTTLDLDDDVAHVNWRYNYRYYGFIIRPVCP